MNGRFESRKDEWCNDIKKSIRTTNKTTKELANKYENQFSDMKLKFSIVLFLFFFFIIYWSSFSRRTRDRFPLESHRVVLQYGMNIFFYCQNNGSVSGMARRDERLHIRYALCDVILDSPRNLYHLSASFVSTVLCFAVYLFPSSQTMCCFFMLHFYIPTKTTKVRMSPLKPKHDLVCLRRSLSGPAIIEYKTSIRITAPMMIYK